MILAGDVGGTHARLALFTVESGRLKALAERIYPSREHPSLDSVARTFMTDTGMRPQYACFGIAGPVSSGRVAMANLKWVIESSSLAKQLGIADATLINDLEATAYGIAALAPGDFEVLNAGAPEARGNAAVIAAGTGLENRDCTGTARGTIRSPAKADTPISVRPTTCKVKCSSTCGGSSAT